MNRKHFPNFLTVVQSAISILLTLANKRSALSYVAHTVSMFTSIKLKAYKPILGNHAPKPNNQLLCYIHQLTFTSIFYRIKQSISPLDMEDRYSWKTKIAIGWASSSFPAYGWRKLRHLSFFSGIVILTSFSAFSTSVVPILHHLWYNIHPTWHIDYQNKLDMTFLNWHVALSQLNTMSPRPVDRLTSSLCTHFARDCMGWCDHVSGHTTGEK